MVIGQKGKSFRRAPLEGHLDDCLFKTLGELDLAGVFAAPNAKRNKGIVGDVVEQSILFLEKDPKPEPDIEVDGVRYEVKSTGVRQSKRDSHELEAKEPVTITDVSPDRIVSQKYTDSVFLHKIAHIVFFYYLYRPSEKKEDKPAEESMLRYADFPVVSYQFHEYADFTEEERRTLESDWACVRDFIASLQRDFDDFRSQYPRLSSELRDSLLLLDTAPKWPHPPRFRFKRSFVTNIFRRYANSRTILEHLPVRLTSRAELVRKCESIARPLVGRTVGSILESFGIAVPSDLKSIAEPLIVRMFGGTRKRMDQVEFFQKTGIAGKSIVLSPEGRRTEDVKFFTIDFDEFGDTDREFEDSQFYEWFSAHKVLFAVFREPQPGAPLDKNIFSGFSLVSFNEDFIQGPVRQTWERIRDLIQNRELKDIPIIDRRTGQPIVNSTGVARSVPNFPKSSEGLVFVRGTSTDSRRKPECVNGIRMYRQQVWVKGSYLVEVVNSRPLIV